MIAEFKKFILRGNVIDLAVAVIIGAAFSGITNSLVNDIIMPPIGLLTGRVDFSNLYLNLSGGQYASLADAQAAEAVTVNYGLFVNAVVNFLIVGLAVFMVVRLVNRLQTAPTAPPPTPNTKECTYCFSTIPLKATRCPQCTSELTSA